MPCEIHAENLEFGDKATKYHNGAFKNYITARGGSVNDFVIYRCVYVEGILF